MGAPEQSALPLSSWPERLSWGAVSGVLLVWVALGVSDAVHLRVPRGKMDPDRPLWLPLALGLGLGFVISCLPRFVRVTVRAGSLGAFAGYLGALVIGRCAVGFGSDVGWREFLMGVRSALPFTVPLGVLVGWLVAWRLARVGQRARPAERPSSAPPAHSQSGS